MKDNITLLQRAEKDFFTAELLFANRGEDELLIDNIAYHIQQGIEKCLKFRIQLAGEDYPNTHSIKHLINILDNNDIEVPDWITDNHYILTSYATQTRYSTSVVSTLREIKTFMEEGKKYAENLNGFRETNALSDKK